ncbi:MAG: PQQ-binding-like beta-propeller repeat protein, partial [Chitinivibrionales bacterium]|nr:PQQ-binding-like beta-propeller repeat protein [Chitinivibrionales bacterium]
NNLRRMDPLQRKKWLEYYQKQGAAWAGQYSLHKITARAAATFVPEDNSIRTSSVALDSGRVFVVQRQAGSSGDLNLTPQTRFTLLALDIFSGSEIWRFTDYRPIIPLGYNSSPIIAHDKVFCGWGGGMLYAFNARTGKKLWQDSLQGDIISSPAAAQGKLFAATMNGYVYAYALDATVHPANFNDGTFCYPNPANGRQSNIQVFVTRPATLILQLFSMAEKPVLYVKQSLAANQPFTYAWNLAKVANGVYFAKVSVKYDDGGSDYKMLKIAVLK